MKKVESVSQKTIKCGSYFKHKMAQYFSVLLHSFHKDNSRFSLVEMSVGFLEKIPKWNLGWGLQICR